MLAILQFSHVKDVSQLLSQAIAVKRASCPGPGTFVNGTGGCECAADTPFGDPESKEGCWSCSPQCDLNAQCVSRNTCVCNEGFIGDGIDFCEKPVPTLVSISPKDGYVNGGTDIDFEISVNANNYTVTKAYCRFGPVIVDAHEMSSSKIRCKTHKMKAGDVNVSVSFDAIRWSSNKLLFTVKESGMSSFNKICWFIIITLLVMLLVMVLWYLQRNGQGGEAQDEILPLNKWHMSAPRINPSNEKGWMDFLWNITVE